MKIKITPLLFLFVFNISFAQHDKQEEFPRFKLEFNTALLHSYISNNFYENINESENIRYSYIFNSLLSYKANSRISISSGISFRNLIFEYKNRASVLYSLNASNADDFYILNEHDVIFNNSFTTYQVQAQTTSLILNDEKDYIDGESFYLFLAGRQNLKFIGLPVNSTLIIKSGKRSNLIANIGFEGLYLFDFELNINSGQTRQYGIHSSSKYYRNTNGVVKRRMTVTNSNLAVNNVDKKFNLLFTIGLGASFNASKKFESKFLINYSRSLIALPNSSIEKVYLSNFEFQIGLAYKLKH